MLSKASKIMNHTNNTVESRFSEVFGQPPEASQVVAEGDGLRVTVIKWSAAW